MDATGAQVYTVQCTGVHTTFVCNQAEKKGSRRTNHFPSCFSLVRGQS